MARKNLLFLLAALATVGCDDDPSSPGRTITRVDVGPAQLSVPVGDTAWLTAYPRSADGRVVLFTGAVT
jgi:hypothetical protein